MGSKTYQQLFYWKNYLVIILSHLSGFSFIQVNRNKTIRWMDCIEYTGAIGFRRTSDLFFRYGFNEVYNGQISKKNALRILLIQGEVSDKSSFIYPREKGKSSLRLAE
jgi:hypothetical protein